jgi:hypothetical protein
VGQGELAGPAHELLGVLGHRFRVNRLGTAVNTGYFSQAGNQAPGAE